MKKIGIVNGPNLDRLGKREPAIYGHQTLEDLETAIQETAALLGVEVALFQSNLEGELIDRIARWVDLGFDGIILNGAGLTHTSVALRDAVSGSGLPVIEVHLSNIHAREEFRRHSVTGGACAGVVTGLGFDGYLLALRYLADMD